jgi:polyisoprenyl-teichoic acid--peptidoglycan teichoic acid transferase
MSGKCSNRMVCNSIRCILPVLVSFYLSGCSFFSQPAKPTSVIQNGSTEPATKTATSTRIILTATKVPPTQTETPSPTYTFTPIPTQTPTRELPGVRYPETPEPVNRLLSYPSGQVKILLLGSDSRGGSSFRTDSIVILAINPQQETASLLSIPPALYVNIPEVGMERINSAASFGGAGKVMDTLQYNLGFRPDKFLTIDFNNFTKIIGYLESIDVYAAKALTDRCDLPQAVHGWCTAAKGWNKMNNDTALWYIRSTKGGDSSRMLRGQEALIAIFSRLMSIHASTRIEELFATFNQSVETDLSIGDLQNLAPLAPVLLKPDHIHRFSFTSTEAVPFVLPGGENVLLLNQKTAWNLVNFAIFEP